jgi:hypothetical protein
MAVSGGSALRGAWERWDTPDCYPEMPNTGSNRKAQPAGLGNQARAVSHWTTPTALERSGQGERNRALVLGVKHWMTPSVTCSSGNEYTRDGGEKGKERPTLQGQANNWPTPSAQQYGGTAEQHLARKRKMSGGARKTITELNAYVGAWPTPASRDWKGANSEAHATVTGGGRKHMDQLANFVAYSPLAQPISDGPESSASGESSARRLNPIFGEWLMGWRSQWTKAEPHAFGASETELFRSRLQQQLLCLLGERV